MFSEHNTFTSEPYMEYDNRYSLKFKIFIFWVYIIIDEEFISLFKSYILEFAWDNIEIASLLCKLEISILKEICLNNRLLSWCMIAPKLTGGSQW